MMRFVKCFGITALSGLALIAVTASPAQAQRNRAIVAGYGGIPLNPNWLVAPGVTLRQAAYNTRVAGRALASIPPWMYGYNPYPSPVVNYGQMYGPSSLYSSPYTNPYVNPYASAYANPYSNPYASLYSGVGPGYGYGGTAALTSATGLPTSAGYGGYGNGYSPYSSYYDPSGGFLRGVADSVNSQGQFLIQEQQARMTKEQAKSLAIDNRRKLFDEIMYERQHTPSFAEDQERIAALHLRRAQNTAAITEIWSAKSLNELLKDLKKLHGDKVAGPEIELDPDVLKQINIQAGKGNGNVGILRNEGRLSWPIGLTDDLKNGAEEAKEIRSILDSQALRAVQQAANGKVNVGVIKDLKKNVADLQKILTSNVKEMPTSEYIEAKRFLNNFEDAIKALQEENVGTYFNQNWVSKVKTVQDLVDLMTKKGLTFAGAVSGDEAAYQALYNALVAYDKAANRAKASAKNE
jgi:hypothetical protein